MRGKPTRRVADREAGVLEAHEITVDFLGLRALDEVSLLLRGGEILGLIGPNGAGKTTFINVVSGVQPPSNGGITWNGTSITGWKPDRLARAGITRTFQGVRVFPDLTVLENVESGAVGVGWWRRKAREQARELLDWVGLSHLASARAGSLPAGEERLVGVLRAVATNPRLLLLDEPAAGLNEGESADLMRLVQKARERLDCGVLLIEHDMAVVMAVCDRVHVLDQGRTLAVGTPTEIREHDDVIRAYLGPGGCGS